MIKDWNPSHPNSHLLGDMTYKDGKPTVPISGRYYIYAQIYFYKHRMPIMIHVINKRIIVIQPPSPTGSEITLHSSGVFDLTAGDVITVLLDGPTIRIYMSSNHSYFGAFLIWASFIANGNDTTTSKIKDLRLLNL